MRFQKAILLNILPATLCAAALLCFLTEPLAAQQPTPAPSAPAPELPNPGTLAPKFSGNYLTPLLTLRPLRASYQNSTEWRGYYFQLLSWDDSYVGNDREALADADSSFLPPSSLTLPTEAEVAQAKIALQADTAVDARQAVFSLAAHRQAVFINESHYLPMDRAFTLSLLQGLYAQGFRYFAAEALDARDVGLQSRGYPTIRTGTYTGEPVFGDLIRTALKMGYKVVPYEYSGPRLSDPIADANQRERGEAQNLYERVFQKDPKAKVVVYAGEGHISKKTTTLNLTPGAITSKTASGTLTFMALWFEKISKIMPLSVDQTNMVESSVPQYEDQFYRAAIADNLLQEKPVVLKDKLGHFFVAPDDRGAYDLSVFHPRTQYEFGRPTWLSEDGQRQAYILPGDLGIPANTPALVQAFYADEDAKIAVPVDQIEVKPGLNPLPALMLPAGRFHLQVVDGSGKVLREWTVDRNGATP